MLLTILLTTFKNLFVVNIGILALLTFFFYYYYFWKLRIWLFWHFQKLQKGQYWRYSWFLLPFMFTISCVFFLFRVDSFDRLIFFCYNPELDSFTFCTSEPIHLFTPCSRLFFIEFTCVMNRLSAPVSPGPCLQPPGFTAAPWSRERK